MIYNVPFEFSEGFRLSKDHIKVDRSYSYCDGSDDSTVSQEDLTD